MNANSSATNKTGLYLITGAAGSGKTTIAQVISTYGYATVDGGIISQWVNKETKKVPKDTHPSDAAWVQQHYWEWIPEELEALSVQSKHELLILAGSADHMDQYWHLFTKVFLLEVDATTTEKRVLNRTESTYGKGEGQMEVILAWKEELSELAHTHGAVRIDTSQPPETVAKNIVEQL